MLTRRIVSILVLLAGLIAWPAAAYELINSYHQTIDVQKNGTLAVTESINVTAANEQIKRGIYRDFPLTFRGDDGRIRHVGFTITGIERDGAPEDYHTESIPGGIRIYIGNADRFVSPGEHTYTISYETTRQIRHFADHDELYWNVTGNGWVFSMVEVTATVTLPEGVKANGTTFFTGPLGAKEKNARVLEEDGQIFFATTQPLMANEGLTIGVSMPKGSIDPPSASDEGWHWIRDHINFVLGAGGFLLVLLFYAINWLRHGRDPHGGVVVPRWDAPDNLSPAMLNYIDQKSFFDGGWTALSATALDMAVKGYIKMSDVSESITMVRTDKPAPADLPAGAAEFLGSFKGTATTMTIDKANGVRIKNVGDRFTEAIGKAAAGKYYKFNAGIIALGFIISVALYVCFLVFGDTNDAVMSLLIVPPVVALFFGIFLFVIVKVLMKSAGLFGRIVGWILLIVAVLVVGLILLGVFGIATGSLQTFDDWSLVGGAIGIIVANFFGVAFMGAPTPDGARIRAGIAGMRQYLTLAEKDRMNMQGAPTMSPQHFETMLPFAVALGVEKPWSDSFQTWLNSAAAGAAAASYQPYWYDGHFDRNRFGNQMSTFSSSMASSMSASLPAPPPSSSSSFSGGGGSSGGGGGGGGGGGW